MSKKYTTADIARTLAVSERTVRRKLSKHLILSDGKYEISEEFFNFLKQNNNFKDTPSDKTRTPSDTLGQDEEFDIIEGFTAKEYQEFQKRLTEYPLLNDIIANLKNDIEYHKRSAESQNKQLEMLLESIKQRNFIEAKDKQIE